MEPLEVAIRTLFTPAITGRTPPNNIECRLFALPAQHGLGIVSPSSLSGEYNWSQKVSAPLVSLILAQSFNNPPESYNDQLDLNKEIKKFSRGQWKLLSDQLKADLSSELLYSTQLAEEKGASNWLTSLPIQEHGFSLHKAAFRDALALRYGWRPNNLPSECICGKSLSVDHALSCSCGGFPMLRHNELRDLTASLLSEVCTNVAVEPPLQELSGEELSGAAANKKNGARLDIVADGFWGLSRERTYFDVRVFNPYAISNRQSSLSTTYRTHEREKKRQYLQRICDVEHSSFYPRVLLYQWNGQGSICFFTNAWPHSSLSCTNKHTVPPWLG